MFKHLKKHRNIFVTGPHRSGTTIAAKMIANDTGHDLVLEDDFYYSNLKQLLTFIQSDYGPLVVQCPFLSDIIHDLNYLGDIDMEQSLVVFMHRYRRDIIASEGRARTKNGSPVDFDRIAQGQKNRYHSKTAQHISDLKYEAWEDQCKVIPNGLDVGYEELKAHPMFINGKRNFSIRQTEPGVEPSLVPPQARLPGQFANAIRALSNI